MPNCFNKEHRTGEWLVSRYLIPPKRASGIHQAAERSRQPAWKLAMRKRF